MKRILYYRKKTPEYRNYHKENMDRLNKLRLKELRELSLMMCFTPESISRRHANEILRENL